MINPEDLHELFEKHNDEFLKFERVENKRSNRDDLHAFLLLDSLVPGSGDIVAAAEHDEIWLDIAPKEFAKVATEAHIIELTRCGVRYDRQNDSFAMFV
jgi:hypothetical protein